MTFPLDPATLYVFDWLVDSQPANPTGPSAYLPTPSPRYLLQETKPEFRSSTMHFSDKTLKRAENLWMPYSNNMFKPKDGRSAWSIINGGTASFKCKLEKKVDVFFRVRCSGTPALGSEAAIGLRVNGTKTVADHYVKNYDQHLYSFEIKKSDLKTGDNWIDLICDGGERLELTAVTLEQTGQCKVSYFWQRLAEHDVKPYDTYAFDKKFTVGVSHTDSTSETFSKSFGVSVSAGGIESLLKKLGVSLSASFSHSSTTTHSITMSKSESTGYSFSVKAPPDKQITFQLWQLCLEYEAYGHKLIQELGPANGAIVSRQVVSPANPAQTT